jgi:hypothetical protein
LKTSVGALYSYGSIKITIFLSNIFTISKSENSFSLLFKGLDLTATYKNKLNKS